MSGDDELLFDDAADYVGAAVTSKHPAFTDRNTQLALYGLYKQATTGVCHVGKPGIFDLSGRAKWDAWSRLGDMSTEEAKQKYVCMVTEIDSEWQSKSQSGRSKKSGMGPVFSSFAHDDGEQDDANTECNIHELAGQGDSVGVSKLLCSGTPVNQQDEAGCTALHFAADRGCLQVMELLLEAGSDINACDEDGQTPLHYAALCGHQQACKLLLNRGADAGAADVQGQQPKDIAPSGWSIWPA